MAELKPIAASNFYFEIDGMTDMQFSKVGGVKFAAKVKGQDKPLMSTKGGKTVRQINSAGFEGLFTMDVTTLMSGDSDSTSAKMYAWFKKCLPAAEKGEGKWLDSKKTGSVTAYDTDGNEVMRWDLKEAWPSAYKVGDLDVNGSDYIEETYTLTCENMNRVK
ncbi:phage tail protein (plasmid) [Kovacikia minuta CCNUW1]|uniref:phage tail protein n=1 Tax=Kovacikia minuta TaxID=2931930 RepID=UPI001CCD9C98|nr:phage tail protein [Kovacikia minuta]UBF30550.1 phage tail protein [Kovacikia minuta CCNUW1]